MLFRLGYFNFAKLNLQNMLMEYEENKWYSIDLILDWDDQRASIYIDDEGYKSDAFFTKRKEKLNSGNALSIYGLAPESVSKFRNIQVCSDICPGFENKNFETLSAAVYGLNSSFSIMVGVSTLLAFLVA